MKPTPDLTVFDDGLNDEERCGVIVHRGDSTHYVIELPNRSDEPHKTYRLAYADMKELVLPEGHSVIGFVHTHPRGVPRLPSPHDIQSLPTGVIGMVYHPSTGSTTWYDRDGIIDTQLKRRR